MPAKHSHHVALTGPLTEWVEAQVARGEYASTSDLVRAAIRLLKAQGEARSAPMPVDAPPPEAEGEARA